MKKLIKSGVIMLVVATLVAANYFAVYWFTPYPRYVAWKKTPIESAELFDYPDQILFYADGKTKILTKEEDISEAYGAFWKYLGNEMRITPVEYAIKTPSWNDKMSTRDRRKANICMEFRYDQRRTCTLQFEEVWATPRTMEYDAILVTFPYRRVYQCLDGKYKEGIIPSELWAQGSRADFESYVYSLF